MVYLPHMHSDTYSYMVAIPEREEVLPGAGECVCVYACMVPPFNTRYVISVPIECGLCPYYERWTFMTRQ